MKKLTISSLMYLSKTNNEQFKEFDTSLPLRMVQMTAEECKALCDAIGLQYVPGYENRVIERVTSTETPDRMGDIVRAAGIDNKAYRKNPVVLFAHDHRNLPIGASLQEAMFNNSTTKGNVSCRCLVVVDLKGNCFLL